MRKNKDHSKKVVAHYYRIICTFFDNFSIKRWKKEIKSILSHDLRQRIYIFARNQYNQQIW